MRAVVVGGGLAGLAAALELADGGHQVTLLEARPTLGGAVQTLPEREGDPDPPPDNGQHIALGCCTEYLAFLERVGSRAAYRRERLALPVIAEDGSVARVAAGPLALLRYGHVSLGERLAIARVARRLGRLEADELDGETFAELLRRLGQGQAAIDRFWDVFIRPALNLRAEEVSAALGVFTVQTALLAERSASDLVLPIEPLGAMHGEAAAGALADRGAVVRTNARVVDLADGAVVLAEGERIEAEAIVVALPPAESASLLGEPDPQLEDSPIVERPSALRPVDPAVRASRAPRKPRALGLRPRRAHRPPAASRVSTSRWSRAARPSSSSFAAARSSNTMAAELTGRLGAAELLWSRVSREPAATFAGRPGTAARRLGPETGRPGVARAGAWTATGWPATMESAVRSGRAAAAVLVRDSSQAPARA